MDTGLIFDAENCEFQAMYRRILLYFKKVSGEIKGYGMIVMLQDKRSFRILFFQFCGFDDLSAVKKGGVEEISKSIIIALEIF